MFKSWFEVLNHNEAFCNYSLETEAIVLVTVGLLSSNLFSLFFTINEVVVLLNHGITRRAGCCFGA